MTRRKQHVNKPSKPYKEYPLYAHASGQWAKRVNGRTRFFGVWDDPDAALAKYLAERDYLHAGVPVPSQQRTVADLCNDFLGSKKTQHDLGELSDSSWNEIVRVCDCIVKQLGKNRPLEGLNLGGLRAALAAGKNGQLGVHALKRRLSIARSVFKFGEIAHRGELKAPPARMLRQAKQERFYEAKELRAIVAAASEPMRSAVILGLAAGYGPDDVCTVQGDAIRGEFVVHRRGKTGIDRIAWLWKEIKTLPPYPSNWSRFTIARDFEALATAAGVPNHGFYSLRRTAKTVLDALDVGEATKDAIFGWANQSIAATYRQKTFQSRIKAAGEQLRKWYLGKLNIA